MGEMVDARPAADVSKNTKEDDKKIQKRPGILGNGVARASRTPELTLSCRKPFETFTSFPHGIFKLVNNTSAFLVDPETVPIWLCTPEC
jgi:hypothetical protein